MKYLHIIFIILVISAIGCRKDFETTKVTDNPHTPVLLGNYDPIIEEVISTVAGTVIDEMGAPVEGAIVSIGALEKTTDAFGVFLFKNTSMNKKGTFVQVEKDGYFIGGRRFYPRENTPSQVRIELLEKTFTESFDASAGGTVDISDGGGSIVFSPNSIKTNSGSIYNGTVKVATKWLSPTEQKTFDQMPGALQGVDARNEEVGLTTYGMIGVELEGSAGEKLNIADGFTAELSIEVPASLQSVAPAEIPLWSFDYTYGIWVEEGSATLQNGKYVGEVSHFSFWNCDYPGKVVEFEVKVINQNTGTPFAFAEVVMTLVDGISSGHGYTNSEGIASGLIPSGEEFNLKVFGPSPCGTEIYSTTVGPFTTDVILDDILISSAQFITFTGDILDCNNTPTTNGALVLKMNGTYSTHLINSNPFEFTIFDCSNGTDIEIAGVDLENGTQGSMITAPANGNVGSLLACGDLLTGFMKITIDGTSEIYPANIRQVPDTLTPFLTQINYANNFTINDSVAIYMGVTNSTNPPVWSVGDFSNSNYIDIIHVSKNGWRIANNGPEFDSFTFTEYGIFNNTIVEGYASGNLINNYASLDVPVFVELEFRAYRMGN